MTTRAPKGQNKNGAVGKDAEGEPVETGVVVPEESDAVTPEGERMHTRTVRPYVDPADDPADDPSGGITGVPVDYIPAPAVP